MKRASDKFIRQAERFRGYYENLLTVSGLGRIEQYSQHGSTSRLLHSAAVAYYSYRLAQLFRVPCHDEEMVRGALLHDYFLYDARDPSRRGHWTRHPRIALENAGKELELTGIEKDVIQKHMFPLTPELPRCRESVLVTLADKFCSVYEFFNRSAPYKRLRKDVLQAAAPCPGE